MPTSAVPTTYTTVASTVACMFSSKCPGLRICNFLDMFFPSLMSPVLSSSCRLQLMADLYFYAKSLACCTQHLSQGTGNASRFILDWQDLWVCLVKFINSLHVQQKQKHIFTISIIPLHWHDADSGNPSSCRTRTHLIYIVNIMAADGLAKQGAKASTIMTLT